MDWTSLIGPAVIAAAVSGVISIVGLVVSTRTARAIHSEKLVFDRNLAERKFEFDKDLAERKFRYDRDLHDHTRRVELAEDVLTAFYRVQVVLVHVRSPLSLGNEGEQRPRRGYESESLARLRDSYYVPIARLNREAEVFAKLSGNQGSIQSLFW
jgi:hypothetical protein